MLVCLCAHWSLHETTHWIGPPMYLPCLFVHQNGDLEKIRFMTLRNLGKYDLGKYGLIAFPSLKKNFTLSVLMENCLKVGFHDSAWRPRKDMPWIRTKTISLYMACKKLPVPPRSSKLTLYCRLQMWCGKSLPTDGRDVLLQVGQFHSWCTLFLVMSWGGLQTERPSYKHS